MLMVAISDLFEDIGYDFIDEGQTSTIFQTIS